MRTQVPVAIAFVAGVAMLIQFFVPTHLSSGFRDLMLMWSRIVFGFAFAVGIVSLIKVNLDKVSRHREGWPYSVITLTGFAVMAALGFLGDPKAEEGVRHSGEAAFQWLFNNVQVPMDATIFSLLAFFIASAAYRTFRARTLEAGLLLAAAVIVMLGRVPLGVAIGAGIRDALHLTFLSSEWLADLTEWILDYPNLAAKRAVLFGASLAAVAQALRIILGIERPYMSGS